MPTGHLVSGNSPGQNSDAPCNAATLQMRFRFGPGKAISVGSHIVSHGGRALFLQWTLQRIQRWSPALGDRAVVGCMTRVQQEGKMSWSVCMWQHLLEPVHFFGVSNWLPCFWVTVCVKKRKRPLQNVSCNIFCNLTSYTIYYYSLTANISRAVFSQRFPGSDAVLNSISGVLLFAQNCFRRNKYIWILSSEKHVKYFCRSLAGYAVEEFLHCLCNVFVKWHNILDKGIDFYTFGVCMQ